MARVIHVRLSVEEANSKVPLVLSGAAPPLSNTSNPGSQHYGERPAAIVFGGGFDDATIAGIQDACGAQGEKVPWFQTDTTRQAEMPDLSDIEGYGKATAARLKKRLEELKVGREGAVEQGMYLF